MSGTPGAPPAIHRPNLAIRFLRRLDFPRKLGICERLFGNSLATLGVCWIETAAGIPWKLDLALSTHRWIVYGKYEGSGFLDWARAYLPRHGVVVDSGANIGQMVLYLAQWVPDGAVIAVEPGERTAAWLAECLTLNSQLPVKIVREALGSRACEMVLAPVDDERRHGACNQIRTSGPGERIRVRPLPEILREHGIDTVDLWVLDLEGYELEALAGAKPLLEADRIGAIYAELAFGNGPAIRTYLEGFGYECHLLTASGKTYSPHHLPAHVNALFLRRH